MPNPKFSEGEEVIFASRAGRKFTAVVTDPQVRQRRIEIRITGDPFSSLVNIAQVHKQGDSMPATRGPETRRLAKEARMLGIKDYQQMSAKQLAQAIENHKNPPRTTRKPAKAAVSPRKATKRAPAKKATSKPAKASRTAKTLAAKVKATNGNPFRIGCNNYKIAEELLRGGRRIDMIKRLKKGMKVHPWSKPKEENPDEAINKRILLAAGILEKDFGFKVVRDGRGTTGTIKVFPPGKSTGQKKATKANSSRKTTSRK